MNLPEIEDIINPGLRRRQASLHIRDGTVKRPPSAILHAPGIDDVLLPRLSDVLGRQSSLSLQESNRGENSELGVICALTALVHVHDQAVARAKSVIATDVTDGVSNGQADETPDRFVAEKLVVLLEIVPR